VKLKINQKIDDFKADPNAQPGKGLPKATRAAVTEVMVRDRDTIAMGGLLRDREVVENNKIPILGDIPVLGWLFKNSTRRIEKVNLLFFITPKILAPYARTASKNTKDVLERRSRGMRDMFEDDQKDPNAKISKDLTKKLETQMEGPLYDMADADLYKNLNNDAIGRGGENTNTEDDEDMDTPDYQGIRKSVE
jgi:general secretion pathway protein D